MFIPFVDEHRKKIHISLLSGNTSPMVIDFLDQNLDKVNWSVLSYHSRAAHILERNQDKINWLNLSHNSGAIGLIEKNLDKIDWDRLSGNPSAVPLLEENPDKIYWTYLSANPSAVPLLEENPDKICWTNLSRNSGAVHLLDANPDKIRLGHVTSNPNAVHYYPDHYPTPSDGYDDSEYFNMVSSICGNPEAIHLLNAYFDSEDFDSDFVDWTYLSSNPKAIHLLERYPDQINWAILSMNPGIFTYNYKKMMMRMSESGLGAQISQHRIPDDVPLITHGFKTPEMIKYEFGNVCDEEGPIMGPAPKKVKR